MPAASVIVPARNAEPTIARTLACLASQDAEQDYEVLVVDDGSSDRTVQIAESSLVVKRVLRQEMLGAAEARNRGVAAASAPALAFLDADCFPTPGWLRAGLRALERVELVQGQVLPDPGAKLGPFDRTLWVTLGSGLWETANLLVTREVFERVGGFQDWLDVEIGKVMAEDVWFGWRARRAGASSAFCADALAYHAVFRRGPLEYMAERRRLRYFPEIARKVPELRRTMFFGRAFLSSRSAAFDAALAGGAVALAARSPLPLAAALPYARMAWGRARSHRRLRAPAIAAIDLAADALSLAELLRGSIKARSLVL